MPEGDVVYHTTERLRDTPAGKPLTRSNFRHRTNLAAEHITGPAELAVHHDNATHHTNPVSGHAGG
ncbi:hypothetical protein [Nocardia sp. BMG51109]|uniref:hypothetical protein n=1 Tax=Nocardia sp. BMG51109 TaxID=1056816 RepID=UPI000464F3C2|nr:hypothetical protein [Nocardia sp. BMG51109]